MHGIIHAGLKKYVEENHGGDAWDSILEKAGLGKKIYAFNVAYPDEEAVAIVGAASEITETPVGEILEDFALEAQPGAWSGPELATRHQEGLRWTAPPSSGRY